MLSGDASNAKRLRTELHSWLLGAGINGVVGSDIVGAVSEAFGNAVEHPLGRASDQVVVEGAIASREVVLWVRDDGSWNDAVDGDRPHLGLVMMNQMMNAVEIERGSDGTVVTLRRSL